MYFNYKRRRHPIGGMAVAALALIGCQTLQAPPELAGQDLSSVPMQATASALPEGWHHGAFMEIFVRAWKDSDGDGIGDLKGLTQTLDYLQELGVKGLWLMPIQPNADGDHGYAPTDFRRIAPEYGTLEDFDELLKQAHARGIGVVTDYVINHASAQHPLFKRAAEGPRDRFRNWFVWEKEKPMGWKIWDVDPWHTTPSGHFFATFGADMPDFNFRNPEVQAFHRSNLRFWLNRGLDGFRLDAVPHLVENSAKDWNDQPESRRLTAEFTQLIKAYPHRYVMCEATAEPQVYGADDLCGGAFAFGYVQHIREAARGKPDSVAVLAEYFKTAPRGMATFLSSHDAWAGQRMMDEMQGDEAAYRLAAATYLLQPGTPFIYYGEEVGMRGLPALKGDPVVRGPMSWTPDAARAGFTTGQPFRAAAPNATTHNAQMQRADAASLFHHYKAMLALRNGLPSVARGSFEQARAQGQVLTWQRQWQQERSVVVINYGHTPQPLTLEGLGAGQAFRAAYPAVAQGLQANAAGAVQVSVPARSVQVWVR